MKLNIFTAKDFAKNDPEVISADKYLHNEYAAIIANEKLNKLIESWPVVYGWYPPTYPQGTWTSSETIHSTSTHTARLAFIEEIKKEPCKHEPKVTEGITSYLPYCKHCGVKLVAEWKVL